MNHEFIREVSIELHLMTKASPLENGDASFKTNVFPIKKLDCRAAGLARAYANAINQLGHEYLAVADISRARGFYDSVDRRLHKIFINRDLKARLHQQVYFPVQTSVCLLVSLLATATQRVDDGHLVHLRLI